MPLTDIACRKAEIKEKPYKMADFAGLYLYVQPNGSRLWRFKYRYDDKEKTFSIGKYPLITLAEAREARDKAKKQLSKNIDPMQAKKSAKLEQKLANAITFEVVAREWHEVNKSGWTDNHGKYILRRLERDIFPLVGNRPIHEISPPEFLEVLRKVEARGAHDIAKRVRQTSGQVFRYAIATGRAQRDPTIDLKDALKPYKKSHFAALTYKELPEFIRALERNDARLYPHTRLAVWLLMLTFVRTSEMIKATWDEIDLDEKQWVIPAARMKMRQEHIVPLSDRAIDVLKQLEKLRIPSSDYIFPAQNKPRKHMSNNTVLKAIERLGYKGQTTGHGFRALAMSTIKEKLNYRHETIDRQLAHGHRSQINAAYDRADFLDERIEMMQDWADYLQTAAEGGKVIQARFGT